MAGRLRRAGRAGPGPAGRRGAPRGGPPPSRTAHRRCRSARGAVGADARPARAARSGAGGVPAGGGRGPGVIAIAACLGVHHQRSGECGAHGPRSRPGCDRRGSAGGRRRPPPRVGAGREGGRYARRARCAPGTGGGTGPAGLHPDGGRLARAAGRDRCPGRCVAGGRGHRRRRARTGPALAGRRAGRATGRRARIGTAAGRRKPRRRDTHRRRSSGSAGRHRRRSDAGGLDRWRPSARPVPLDRPVAGRRDAAWRVAPFARRLAGGDARRRHGRLARPAGAPRSRRVERIRGRAASRTPPRARAGTGGNRPGAVGRSDGGCPRDGRRHRGGAPPGGRATEPGSGRPRRACGGGRAGGGGAHDRASRGG